MVIICLFNEVCYLFSSIILAREDVVYISIYLFQQIGFIVLFFNSSVSTFAMKMFAKATETFVPITDVKVKASQTLKLEQPWTSLSF